MLQRCSLGGLRSIHWSSHGVGPFPLAMHFRSSSSPKIPIPLLTTWNLVDLMYLEISTLPTHEALAMLGHRHTLPSGVCQLSGSFLDEVSLSRRLFGIPSYLVIGLTANRCSAYHYCCAECWRPGAAPGHHALDATRFPRSSDLSHIPSD